jgi:DNA-directed RNA polymerase subunit RPC12/RpoP
MPELQEYKCPNCSAPLSYKPKKGVLECGSCGSSFTIPELSARERNLEEVTAFDWGDWEANLSRDHLANTAVYTCKSCGAAIEADATTGATRCPYCDNNVVLSDRFGGGLRPNGIIPFKITARELPEALKRFYRWKLLLPRGFFSQSSIGDVKGVYVPFWLFDCTLSGGMNLEGTTARHHTEGEYDCTEISHFLLERDGEMSFARIPVDASVKMANDLMDSIEPFDYSELVDFQESYLPGFVADRFDGSPKKELPRASKRVLKSAQEVMEETCVGYGNLKVRMNGMQMTDSAVKYVLLPVYLLNLKYKDKKYRFAVNGQTGKVVGELPISRFKSRLSALIFGATAAVLAYRFLLWLFS